MTSLRERSAHIFKGLSVQRDDLAVRALLKGLELSIEEDHRAMESASDLRKIGVCQGRIELARGIIQHITAPKVARAGGEE